MAANKDREVPVRIIYRKKGHGAAHHGGAWKVAFADFMTAMFAMFLVLWLINQSSDVKSAIAGYFQDPLGRSDEFGSSIMPGEGAQAATVRPMQPRDVVDMRRNKLQVMADRMEQDVKSMPELQSVADKIQIRVTEEGLEIQLLEDSLGIFFESGNAVPSLRGRQILALLGHELSGLPNPVLVAGYTDSRAYHRADGYSNWELSADRANTTRRILNINGVHDERFSQIRGFADRELSDPQHPFAASNRRVAITMMYMPDDPAAPAQEPSTSTASPADTASSAPAHGPGSGT